MKKFTLIGSAVALVVLLGIAALFWFAIRPWLALPETPVDTLDRQWKQVHQWAEINQDPNKTDESLKNIVERFSELKNEWRPLLDNHSEQRNNGSTAWDPLRIDRNELTPSTLVVLDHFVAWSEQEGNLELKNCSEELKPLLLLDLGLAKK